MTSLRRRLQAPEADPTRDAALRRQVPRGCGLDDFELKALSEMTADAYGGPPGASLARPQRQVVEQGAAAAPRVVERGANP